MSAIVLSSARSLSRRAAHLPEINGPPVARGDRFPEKPRGRRGFIPLGESRGADRFPFPSIQFRLLRSDDRGLGAGLPQRREITDAGTGIWVGAIARPRSVARVDLIRLEIAALSGLLLIEGNESRKPSSTRMRSIV